MKLKIYNLLLKQLGMTQTEKKALSLMQIQMKKGLKKKKMT